MRWFSLSGLCLLLGCGSSQMEQKRLNDGSLQITCQLSMDECIRRAQEQCANQRFRILEGTSETRLRDAPPFERAYHTSRLHLVCTNDGADVLLSMSKAETVAKAGPTAPCSAGETRECVGAGACKGGQACLPDGRGFGSCDCGPQQQPSPASTPEPATPAASGSSGADGVPSAPATVAPPP